MVPKTKLRLLPSTFASLPAQAVLVTLAAVKLPKETDYVLEAVDVLKHLSQGKTFQMAILGRVEKVAEVILGERGEANFAGSVNYQLVQAGLGLVEKKKDKRFHALISSLLEAQKEAKSQRVSGTRSLGLEMKASIILLSLSSLPSS